MPLKLRQVRVGRLEWLSGFLNKHHDCNAPNSVRTAITPCSVPSKIARSTFEHPQLHGANNITATFSVLLQKFIKIIIYYEEFFYVKITLFACY